MSKFLKGDVVVFIDNNGSLIYSDLIINGKYKVIDYYVLRTSRLIKVENITNGEVHAWIEEDRFILLSEFRDSKLNDLIK